MITFNDIPNWFALFYKSKVDKTSLDVYEYIYKLFLFFKSYETPKSFTHDFALKNNPEIKYNHMAYHISIKIYNLS